MFNSSDESILITFKTAYVCSAIVEILSWISNRGIPHFKPPWLHIGKLCIVCAKMHILAQYCSAAQLGTFRTRVKILWPLLVYIPCLFLDRLAAALGCQVSSVHGEQYGFWLVSTISENAQHCLANSQSAQTHPITFSSSPPSSLPDERW